MKSVLVLLACFAVTMADVYMHNPRGSNNRLNEKSANRRNANRAFDSQNNNRGGYNVGDKGIKGFKNEDEQYDMRYFQSGSKGKSYLTVEWTNQHGCGANDDSNSNKLNCQVVLQYMCQPDDGKKEIIKYMRNGLNTEQQQFTNQQYTAFNQMTGRRSQNVRMDKVLFEKWEWYDKCIKRNRNQGLFTADQKLKGKSSIYTRQNPGGTRRGYECPEERDYYPYWHPTDWKDIAVLTSDKAQCDYYKKESFNTRSRYECIEKFPSGEIKNSKYNNKQECEDNKGVWTEFHNYLEAAPSVKEADCKKNSKYVWGRKMGGDKLSEPECLVKLPAPDCQQAPWSRVNHLGNGKDGVPLNYTWELPQFPSNKAKRCILRLRYNISTDDYDGWNTDSSSNAVIGKSQSSPIQQNPVVNVGANNQALRLAINTAQFGRTFQDRSHIFKLVPRTDELKDKEDIYNLNVRGKRGNIVQTYPAVEYDFIPNRLTLKDKDLLHIQWTGSNTHNNGNPAGDGQAGDAGEGTGGTDRSNMVETMDPADNFPMTWEKATLFKSAKAIWTHNSKVKNPKPEDIAISMASSGYYSTLIEAKSKAPMNNLLNNAPASYEGMVLQFSKGEYFYTCTRNNNFSNRSQKGWLKVK